jgi:hypothetical protein
MPTLRSDHAEPSLAERLAAIGAGLQRLISAGLAARGEAVVPGRLPTGDRRGGGRAAGQDGSAPHGMPCRAAISAPPTVSPRPWWRKTPAMPKATSSSA